MTKVVICDVADGRASATHASDLTGRDFDGSRTAPRSLEPSSRTFGDDLHLIFSENVTKARLENVNVIGASDVVLGS